MKQQHGLFSSFLLLCRCCYRCSGRRHDRLPIRLFLLRQLVAFITPNNRRFIAIFGPPRVAPIFKSLHNMGTDAPQFHPDFNGGYLPAGYPVVNGSPCHVQFFAQLGRGEHIFAPSEFYFYFARFFRLFVVLLLFHLTLNHAQIAQARRENHFVTVSY